MGLETVLGGRKRGFFIPYRHAGTARPGSYPALEPLFAQAAERMGDLLAALDGHLGDLERFGGPAPEPRFEQDWFPGLDAVALYLMVRRHRPSRIIEVGSGHSTRIMARALADGRLDGAITCIDPAPRASITALDVSHLAAPVERLDDGALPDLAANDILFIDSSHIAMPGTDVDCLVNGVLPRLRAGVLVHFHDIFLPDAYPEAWRWRGYNEQLVVAALLQGGAYQLEFASRYLRARRPELTAHPFLDRVAPAPGVFESSLWLRRRDAG